MTTEFDQVFEDLEVPEYHATSGQPRFQAALTIAFVLACGFTAGYYYSREREYVRVVAAVAEAYEVDPSEVEQDARLVPVDRTTNAVLRRVADCTLEDAHAEKCFIPCSTDADCLAKNGQTDH